VFLALLDARGEVLAHDEASSERLAVRGKTALRDLGLLSRPPGTLASDGGDGFLVGVLPIRSIPSRLLAVAGPAGACGGNLAALLPAIEGTFADLLAAGHDNANLDTMASQLADTYEELALLYQVSGGMRVNRDPEDFFRTMCSEVRGVLATRSLGVLLQTGRGVQSRLIVTGDLDLTPPQLSRFADEVFEELVDRCTTAGGLQGGAAILDNDVAGSAALSWLAPGARQLLAVPLVRTGQVLGFVFALDRDAGVFDSVDAKLLQSVASASAIFLENVVLFDDVHGLLMGLLRSLTSAVDAKDSYTCGHSERVALIARELATVSGFDEVAAERVYMAGLLHDVGKIGVPESVLQKCGRLSQAEFEQMKQHPEIGARILADVRQVQDIIPGVLYHHERFDGKGYPARLAGTDIPILGRIICLADSLDAMTSNRTYRRGMPIRQALAEIARCAGTHFDPELAERLVGIGSERLDELLERHRTDRGRGVQPSLRNLRAA
jgi:HD-GYP domain-containing protein (c-di-GMP phosphodiesterase class II)